MGQRLTFGPNTGQSVVKQDLETPESEKDGPGVPCGQRMVVEQLVKMTDKLSPTFAITGQRDLTVVELCTDPHVPHE